MRDLGNTLIVVEHDEDTMRSADYLIDVGPGAGHAGGEIVAAGTPEEVAANEHSLTGQYLSGKREIPTPAERRAGNGQSIRLTGAAENNLKMSALISSWKVYCCDWGIWFGKINISE